ncbi:leucine-rich melanocyte differentiation-associated protein [Calliphora vicina]|uniref:leucine-rich melanocyte differentiation-associated protein n=1 Tax=Calliphora vicina TaxID=7373 RepID=UPI00325C093D
MNNLYENCYDATKRQLNLSHRNLRSLDSAIITSYAHCTEYLDLSHNRIHSLSWLYEFPHLKCLIMDDNRLREAHFEKLIRPLTNLHTLMLNKNELSDLKMTAGILRRIFPNVEYLSLHGNAMCPDNLLLQPFCEFVPYEYNHYRTVLLKSLPNLKFLDHFSLDALHFNCQTATTQINQQHQHRHQPRQNQQQQLLTSTSKDLWSKVKSFLTVNSSQTTTEFPTTPNNNCVLHCASSSHDSSYCGTHSEGNRYITNSDL